MKKVDIISNIVARKGEALATPSMDISKVNLSGYLLKSIWDKVFEIRTDSQGIEYIFGKLPMVTQYGITMYSGDGVDVPSLASGLPFDGRTIWYNPETQQIEVIGGGSGGGLDITALQNYLTSNSYLNVTSGDNRYLKLSGGTLTGNILLGGTTTNKIGTNIVDTSGGFQEFTHQNSNGYIALGPFNGSVAHIYTDRPSFYFNKDLYVNDAKVWHAGNDGSGSTLDADLLDGVQSSGYGQYVDNLTINLNDARDGFRGGKLYNATNAYDSTDASYRGFLEYGTSGYRAQFNSSSSNNLYYRWCEANTWKPWRKVAFEDSNVASATYAPNTSKLYSTDNIYSYGSANPYYGYLTYNQTHNEWDFKVTPNTPEDIHVNSCDKLRNSRTIWGQSFNGTGNVNGVISGVDGISFNSSNAIDIDYNSNFVFKYTHLQDWSIQKQDTTKIFMVRNDGSVGIGTPSTSAKLHVSGDILGNTICVNNTDGSGNGISLYKGTASINFVTTFGIWFGLTSTYGTHGNVNGDWATYFSMSNDSGRGWIFRRDDGVRVTSISKDGDMLVNGGITMYSDQRKKTILNHVELSLKQIAEAPLIEHYYNSDEKKTTHVGSIAQYWYGLNDWFCKLDSEGYYTMEIQNAALASAISIARELDRYETKTDKAIKKLKKRISELEDEVERLKSA